MNNVLGVKKKKNLAFTYLLESCLFHGCHCPSNTFKQTLVCAVTEDLCSCFLQDVYRLLCDVSLPVGLLEPVIQISSFWKVVKTLEGSRVPFWPLFGPALPGPGEESIVERKCSHWRAEFSCSCCGLLPVLTQARIGCFQCLHTSGRPKNQGKGYIY